MSYTVNRVFLIGRCGQTPELRFTARGDALATFGLATDRPAWAETDGGPDWHEIVCWGKLADFAAEYLAKGRLVFVAGRVSYRAYEDRDGRKRRVAEIVATEVGPLDRPPEREPDPAPVPEAEAVGVPS